VTWGTTEGFLDHFGLESLDDLPGMEELKAAGLLDKRPVLHAFSEQGNLELVNEGDDDGDEVEGELPDPLDPDDGAGPDEEGKPDENDQPVTANEE
jgi:segregation and condensation protein B